MKTTELEGREPWAVVSERSEDTTKGPKPSKSPSFHWMRPSNYFSLQLGQRVYM